jgi:hypothetical protein
LTLREKWRGASLLLTGLPLDRGSSQFLPSAAHFNGEFIDDISYLRNRLITFNHHDIFGCLDIFLVNEAANAYVSFLIYIYSFFTEDRVKVLFFRGMIDPSSLDSKIPCAAPEIEGK